MPDFRVRFVGDLGNLAQFDAAIRNGMGENVRQLQAAQTRIASQVGKISGLYSNKAANITGEGSLGQGLFLDKAMTQIDAFNKTFVHSGELVRRTLTDYKVEADKAGELKINEIFTNEYFGGFTKAKGDLDAYEAAMKKTGRTQKQILQANKVAALEELAIEQRIQTLQASRKGEIGSRAAAEANRFSVNSGKPYRESIADLERQQQGLQLGTHVRVPQFIDVNNTGLGAYPLGDTRKILPLSDIQNERAITEKALHDALHPASAGTAPATKLITQPLEDKIAYLKHAEQNAAQLVGLGVQETGALLAAEKADLAVITAQYDAAIAALEAEIAKATAEGQRVPKRLQRKVNALKASNPAYGEAEAALNAPAPINKNLSVALEQSKELRKNLLAGGLGNGSQYGTEQFKKALGEQEAAVQSFQKNLRTGVTTIQGSYKDLKTGVTQNFTADLDKQGKVIGRWGGQLSGSGAILKQTVRDFQKVIEWTLATTAVFGTLGLAIKSLSTINELNESLTRFSITAQLSSKETNDLFLRLGDVAIATATPLQELVKVADDIALATKSAGDSTVEWQQKIIDLTRAVGIFTNLTGTTTVEAADKLSSAFKQLSIAPSDLVGVLSKVSAVSGGQSTAINEIVTALGGVAEAAKAAGLTLDEQIASVQVLSQVTNKSAADVATAFKNLFGSISSVGSVKILKEFGIEVRDAAGNLRPFLTIYREIADAINKGVIPAGRVQDVLRGISGGPRRSPDAAALLGNLPLVEAAIEKSTGATNEALIANAKILDTNKAKIVQLQNAFDIALFEKFGATVARVTDSFTSFLTTLLQLFNSVDPKVLAIIVQLGAIAVAGKLLGTVFKASFGIIGKGLTDTYKSAKTTAAAVAISAKQEAIYYGIQNLSNKNTTSGASITNPLGLGGASRVKRTQAGVAYQFRDASGRFVALKDAAQYSSTVGGNFGAINPKYVPLNERVGPFLSKPSNLLKIGAVGALAAGGIAATGAALKNGGIDKNTIGTVLQLAGSISLMTGVLAPLGAAALVAGTALQVFGNDASDVAKSQDDLRKEAFDLTQALKTAQQDAKDFAKTQEESGAAIDRLRKKTSLTKEEQGLLSSETETFVTATLSLAAANQKVSDTFDELISKIPELKDHYSTFVNAVKSGQLSPTSPLVKDLRTQLTQDILANTGQQIYRNTNPITASRKISYSPDAVDTNAYSNFGPKDQPRELFDLSTLLKDPTGLKELFLGDLPQGATSKYDIPANDLNVKYLQTALDQLPELISSGKTDIKQEDYQKLADAIGALATRTGTVAENQAIVAQQKAGLQADVALGLRTGKEATNINTATAIQDAITTIIAKAPRQEISRGDNRGTTSVPSQTAQNLQGQFADVQKFAQSGLDIPNNLLIQIGENALKAQKTSSQLGNAFDDLASKGDEALNRGIIAELKLMGITEEQAKSLMDQFGLSIKATGDEADVLKEKLDAALETAASNYADRALQLLVAKNSGQFEDNAAGLKVLTDQNEEAYKSEQKLNAEINNLSDTGLREFAIAISNVTGLTKLKTLSDKELTDQSAELGTMLIETAIKAGVNADGIDTITRAAHNLTAELIAMPEYKKIIIDVQTQISNAVKNGSVENLGNVDYGKNLQTQINAATKAAPSEEQKRQDAVKKYYEQIIAELKKGKGSTLGQLPKDTGTKGSTSLLDLPDDIAQSKRRNQIVAEAIKRAKSLQNIVPGANKDAQKDIVELLSGTNRVREVRGIKEDYLRKALDELSTGAVQKQGIDVSNIDLSKEIADAPNRSSIIQEAIKRARKLQGQIPGENKEASNDVVELLKGTQRILEVRGVKDDYLRKALEELTDVEKKRLDFETKADTIRRIRVGGADFSAIANVPVNTQTGVSLGGSQGPINITLNLNGTVLTPAQFGQFANLVASSLKRQIALG